MPGSRYWGAVAAVILVLGLAFSWGLGSLMVRPNPSAVPDARPPATDLTIRTRDGLALAATYWPGRRADSPAVLLLHGNGASRAAVADNAAWLSSRGYAALAIDFRGHGESPSAAHSFGLYESRDAEAALTWLKQRQRGAKAGVIGISLGGAASLLGERGPLPADAIILQAVYPDIRHAIRNRIAAVAASIPAFLLEPLLSYQSIPRFGVSPGRLSPLAALKRYRGPVLIIGGAEDRFTPPAESKAMFEAAPGRRGLWLAPGVDHAHTSDLRTDEYRRRILGFFSDTIGDPG